MASGTIKTMTDKGFGFIRPDDSREDVFFHRSSVVGTDFEQLQQGDRVTFNTEQDPRGKGPRASDVRVTAD